MKNELLFFVQTIITGFLTLGALAQGRSVLVAAVCVQCLIANLFVLKQITLFGLSATCADAFTVGATLCINLLREYYGADAARQAVRANFFLLVFYAVVSYLHLAYLPSIFDDTQMHFVPLLAPMPRIVIASFTVYYISQTIDYLLYGALKRMLTGRYLFMRNIASAGVSQLIDTVLFGIFGLWGLVENLGQVIAISYMVKIAAILMVAPFLTLSRRVVKRFSSLDGEAG